MSRIITVHGTFAHMTVAGQNSLAGGLERQWWERESRFCDELKAELKSADGTSDIEFEPFIWTGDNSERARRIAAWRLLNRMKELEAIGEPYAVIGHSHGGSVVANALLLAARQKTRLDNLQKWITVGTPFVHLRKERFLFLRLPLIWKALFVASLMMLFMFLFNFVFEQLGQDGQREGDDWQTRALVSAALMSIPFLLFVIVAYLREWGMLFHYGGRLQKRTDDWFGERWLPLTHEGDEALRGLASLDRVEVSIFARDFAVPVLSLLSVFLLPVAYLLIVTSPATMVSVANYLKTEIYKIDEIRLTDEVRMELRIGPVRRAMREVRALREQLEDAATPDDVRGALRERIEGLRLQAREARRALRAQVPEVDKMARAQRFRQQFFTLNGQECANAELCGGGRDLAINSRLLFHLVTDEAAHLISDSETRPDGNLGYFIAALIPVLLVPLVFAVVALLLVFVVYVASRLISSVLSRMLDAVTWKEIRRSALGNDTESEVALKAAYKPYWMSADRGFLPVDVGRSVTTKSNEAAVASIAKFRDALTKFALADTPGQGPDSLLALLSWKELIHMVYFDVPEVRSLIAHSLAERDGFSLPATPGVPKSDARTPAWLMSIRNPKGGDVMRIEAVMPDDGDQPDQRKRAVATAQS
ncbi:MAG: hypothetical protein ACFCUN_09180 [Hyphomicrobiaceae bacterium]